ncbi:SMEK domain-containing protein [Stenotrophomonas sp.]|uniref:SMEK domain-containing protein n=1 Tax=Stenotrophomonas sp. TaxID=69392 RepID=UPI0031CDEBE6
MQHEYLVTEINSLVGSLRAYAEIAVNLQKNIGKPVEALIQGMLSEIEDLNLVNTNLQTNNSEAIDLADSSKGIAIQVTTNASHAKWTETYNMLQKRNMLGSATGQYREVRVIGFCKFSKPRKNSLPKPGLRVEGISSYLEKLPSLSVFQLERIAIHLRSSFDFSRLHPLHDQHCWGVVFHHLNRDALRHPARFEGSCARQTEALMEIKHLMFGSRVKGVKVKPISSYFDLDYQCILSEIDIALGSMLAMLNGLARSGAHSFSATDEVKFDDIRIEIVNKINNFNKTMKLTNLPDIAPFV